MFSVQKLARTYPLETAQVAHRSEQCETHSQPPLLSTLSTDAQLLIACSRTVLNRQTADLIRALAAKVVNWAYVIDKARQHFITPLLYSNLSSACPDRVPKPILDQLAKYCRSRAGYNLFLTKELLTLLQLLEQNKIRALPLKGPILSVLAYGDLSLREFGDLDILVRKQDALKAKDVLVAQGYRPAVALTWMQRTAPRFSRRKDFILTSANDLVRVELHWRLTGKHFSFPLGEKQLWSRLEVMSLAGRHVPSLPAEDLVLFLCVHGARHGWERLEWICDVAELIRAHDLDWTRLLAEATALGNERNLMLGLKLASDLLGTELPESVTHRIRSDQLASALAAQVVDGLFAIAVREGTDIAYWHRYHLKVRERTRDRVRLRLHYYHRYLKLVATPNTRDRTSIPMPSYLSFLYYLVRPIRLIRSRLGHLLTPSVRNSKDVKAHIPRCGENSKAQP